jgi:hypothetical protein
MTQDYMKTSWLKLASIASLAFATLAACSSGESPTTEQEQQPGEAQPGEAQPGQATEEGNSSEMRLGTAEQGVMSCSNLDGTNSAMAALAVAVAQDLGRLQAGKDFKVRLGGWQSESQAGNNAETIILTSGSDASGPIGKSRCSDGKCARVQAILDWQYEQATGKVFFQGSGSTKVLLNPGALRSRMVSKLREQQNFDSRAKDGDPTQAPVEQHKLTFVSAAKGGCDTMFTFQAVKTTGAALQYPAQLKWKLAFADINNPYINFTNLGGGKVAFDPTWGLNEDGTSSGGTCAAACTKVSLSNIATQCCSCGGVNKTFVKAGWSATTFLCL